MTDRRRAIGRDGEERAAQWYLDRGYSIVARNWRCRAGEIDLVALGPETLVFCEVKARSSDRFGAPFEAVTPAKQRRVRMLAAQYLSSVPSPGNREVRFDVAAVFGSHIEVLEGVF